MLDAKPFVLDMLIVKCAVVATEHLSRISANFMLLL
jgi:hypothetical protein